METLNFFSYYLRSHRIARNKKIILSLALSLSIAIPLFLLQYHNLKIRNLESEILQIESILQSRQGNKKMAETIEKEKELKTMKQYYNSLHELDLKINSANKISLNFLTAISTTIPHEISFSSLSLNNNELEIQGISKNNISIAKFEHNLRELDIFKNIHVPTISISDDIEPIYYFILVCKLKDVDP